MDSSEKNSGRLVGHMDWHLLSPFNLSQILPVGDSLSVLFVTRTSCGKITHASCYYLAWPGRAVLVSVSLNSWDSTLSLPTAWGSVCGWGIRIP